jgi:molybdate transport system ATP-binding protein
MIEARIVKRLRGTRGGEPFELNLNLQSDSRVTVLLGPSGAGKTLTLNCLAGFTRPDEGRILIQDQLYFDGTAGVHVPPNRRRCGYILQDHMLFPHMTVRENLSFAAKSIRAPRPGRLDLHRRTKELLEAFELEELEGRMPHQLSGGQKQRVSIARALVGNPRLLLLDEPTRGLDHRLRSAFYEVIQKVKERLESPILIVTHDLDECFELADTLCFIARGQLLQMGKKQDVVTRPASLEVAALLGIYVFFPAEIVLLDPGRRTSRLRVAGQEIDGPYLPGRLLGDQGWICVRRGELSVFPSGLPDTARNEIALPVTGASTTANGARLDFGTDVSVDVSDSEYTELRHSKELRIAIPPNAVHFLSH